ncbi:MAG: sigma-70 family RNA polymerase sigma factor [Planctomycetia bacterium]|nr:sigma-70 family RNA polymerase sigma factor [Planctomycetia bacterium]
MPDAADPTEFERTALPLLPDCYAFALSLTRDATDAEDLVQETFLRAQRSFDQFEPGTHAKAWLFTILRRLHIDRHRRAKVRPSYQPEEEMEVLAVARTEEPAADLPPGVEPGDVLAALDEVPDPFRLAVRLRDIDGFPYQEIGRILGVPPGTVMSRIHRGRESLKQALVLRMERRAGGRTGWRPGSTTGTP